MKLNAVFDSILVFLKKARNVLRRKTEMRIIAIISFSIVALVIMGIVSYSFLTGLLNEMMKEVETNQEVVIIKKIQQGFANVELANVSFKIYDDSSYFTHFSNEMKLLKNNVEELKELNNTSDSKELNIYKSLVDRKIVLMDTLMAMKLMPNYEKYLQKIKEDIATIPAIDNKYKILVGGKRVTQAYLAQSGKVFKKVKNVLDEVRQERKTAYDKINKKLVNLTDSLSFYASEIAAIKQSKAISKGDIANSKLAIIKWMIIFYCILAGSFLLALIYIIVKYLKRNAISKKLLTRSKLRAENLAQTKETFLANMSHEIRTPLNAIVGFSGQLMKTKQSDEQVEQTKIIQKSSEHLLHIVNEILDYSKLENGVMKLEKTPFNPKDIAQEVYEMLLQSAKDRGNDLQLVISPKVPQSLIGDPIRIRQVILNLTANAIKFTKKGSVTILLDCVLLIEEKVDLIIQVKDTGIGIPKEKIKQIFKMFVQADADTTRKFGGTGLGLTICQRIVDVYGGMINVESEPQKETIFTVNLPLSIDDKKTSKAPQNKMSLTEKSMQGKKILIVDDQEFNRKLLRVILNNWEVECTELDDGIQVIEELEKKQYDLILMDIRMPLLDGIKTTKKIRTFTKKQIAKTPVIGISAAITFDDKEEGMNAGMNDFITKPFTEEKLLDILTKYLCTSSDVKAKTEKQVPLNLDFTEIIEISGGDNNIVVNLLEVYLNTTAEGLKLIQNHFENKNKVELREQAHKISSPNRHIGAEHLYRLIKSMEEKAMKDESWEAIATNIKTVNLEFVEVKKLVEHKLKALKSEKNK